MKIEIFDLLYHYRKLVLQKIVNFFPTKYM